MTLKHLIVGIALAIPAATFSTDAAAFVKCDAKEDAKDKEKCEKNEAKRVAKARKSTTPFVPSKLTDKLAELDKANPFDQDDWYVGEYPAYQGGTGDVDKALAAYARIDAALTMAAYIGHLNKTGKADEATKLASALLPELVKMKDDVMAIKASIDGIKSNPSGQIPKNKLDTPKMLADVGGAAAALPGIIADLPKVISAIEPIAKGAAAAGVNMATDAAQDAAGGAMPK